MIRALIFCLFLSNTSVASATLNVEFSKCSFETGLGVSNSDDSRVLSSLEFRLLRDRINLAQKPEEIDAISRELQRVQENMLNGDVADRTKISSLLIKHATKLVTVDRFGLAEDLLVKSYISLSEVEASGILILSSLERLVEVLIVEEKELCALEIAGFLILTAEELLSSKLITQSTYEATQASHSRLLESINEKRRSQ